jgi:quercetin dioxygenase-like cupin family protein
MPLHHSKHGAYGVLVKPQGCLCHLGFWDNSAMTADYKYIEDLAKEVNIPQDGILSRTLFNDDRLRVVLFGFAEGQELTEHTAKVPAVIHILSGEARLRLGAETVEAGAGAWIHMRAELTHGILAKTPVVMLLSMLKQGA